MPAMPPMPTLVPFRVVTRQRVFALELWPGELTRTTHLAPGHALWVMGEDGRECWRVRHANGREYAVPREAVEKG